MLRSFIDVSTTDLVFGRTFSTARVRFRGDGAASIVGDVRSWFSFVVALYFLFGFFFRFVLNFQVAGSHCLVSWPLNSIFVSLSSAERVYYTRIDIA